MTNIAQFGPGRNELNWIHRPTGVLASLACLALAPPLQILFVGNSHTSNGDVPGQVRQLLLSARPERPVSTQMQIGGILNSIARSKDVFQTITGRQWDVIVLQGAEVSSSHKYKYSQEGGVSLAKAALKSGARTLLYAEWPRRGWDESEFTLSVYREIRAAAPGSEIVPVCKAWDMLLKQDPGYKLWAPDGNHSSSIGAYQASCVLATWIDGPGAKFTWEPKEIGAFGRVARDTAIRVVKAAQPGR